MTNSNVITLDREFDPLNHQSQHHQSVTETARPVCIIKLNIGLDNINEMICFNRTKGKDGLCSLTTLDDSIRLTNESDAALLKSVRTAISTRAGTLANLLTAWQAHSAVTNHHLYISPQSDTFGCAYYRLKGGADELKPFLKHRSDLKKSPGGRS